MPGIPGRRQQIPRTWRSTFTPACDARYRAVNAERVDKGIHLEDEVPVPVLLMTCNFPVDAIDNPVPQGYRCNEQFLVLVNPGIPGQEIEQVGNIFPNRLVRGQKSEIRIDPACRGIVITGPEVHIPADPVFFPPDNHAEFGMDLEADNPIHDMDTLVFKRPCPADIVLFIKPGLEFD